MGWLLLWCAIGLLALAVPAVCLWNLWRKGRALLAELSAQGRTLGELSELLGQVQLQSRPEDGPRRAPPQRPGERTGQADRPAGRSESWR